MVSEVEKNTYILCSLSKSIIFSSGCYKLILCHIEQKGCNIEFTCNILPSVLHFATLSFSQVD